VRDLSWTYDDHTHKKTCRCGAVIASGNHSISESALSGTCKTCGYVRIHTCTYTPVPEVPSDCMTKGKMAHYKCEACNKLYIKNSESYVRIYTSDLELPKDKSNHIDTANDLPWTCDSDVHKKCTGCPNELILDNLRYIDSCGKKIEIRIPYVPEYNSGEIEKIGEYLGTLKNLTKVRVLPYHNFAGSKYESLQMENTLPKVDLPSNEEISAVEAMISRFIQT